MGSMVSLLYEIKDYLYRKMGIVDIDQDLEKVITTYYKMVPAVGSGITKKKRGREVILSLTTIPDRITKTWITIESLLRQSCKPDQIILWLAEDEFRGMELPDAIKRQMQRGLTVRYCENLRSYKKFYGTMSENPEAFVVTADDDIIYPEKMLEVLLKTYQENPECVVCNRSHWMRKSHGKLLPYCRWIHWIDRKRGQSEPLYQNFLTSGGGTLFPVFLLDQGILQKDVFVQLAPLADDVWLNFICWISGVKVKNTVGALGNVIFIESSAQKGLLRENVGKSKNDIQIEAVLDYFHIDIDDYI